VLATQAVSRFVSIFGTLKGSGQLTTKTLECRLRLPLMAGVLNRLPIRVGNVIVAQKSDKINILWFKAFLCLTLPALT
jgi:hypothetical protein